jgi:hypothetical protein
MELSLKTMIGFGQSFQNLKGKSLNPVYLDSSNASFSAIFAQSALLYPRFIKKSMKNVNLTL